MTRHRPDASDVGETGRVQLPDPALVVLVGASGSGKSTWAAAHYRDQEVVSSDALRGVVGSGPHDLDASADAFGVLETVVAARLGRGLTTVVDTLGLDPARRQAWLAAARAAGLPAVAVLLDTPDAECRRRNAARDRPVPAPALAGQLRSVARRTPGAGGGGLGPRGPGRRPPRRGAGARGHEPEDRRRTAPPASACAPSSRSPGSRGARTRSPGCPASRGRRTRRASPGLALMDHLIQVPQVGRAWEPIPEPWVTLGADRRARHRPRARHALHPGDVPARRASRPRPPRRCPPSPAAGPSSASVRGGSSASTRRTASRSRRRASGSTTSSARSSR